MPRKSTHDAAPHIPASRWDTEDAITSVPSQVGTIVLAGTVMCVCQVVVAPLYVALSAGLLTVLPWIAVSGLLSVGFCATVGLVLMWVGETVERRVSSRWVPLLYAGMGAACFGLWGGTVVPAIFNSIVAAAGGAALHGMSFWAVVINCIVIGALGFFFGRLLTAKKHVGWPAVWTLIIVELIVAGCGIFFLAQVYSYLY
ncbi:MAG: hypothetical protein LKI93_05330 [Bifidobacteriaceae bacterium]|jgi:hypothetical protein|nr:hypothetical protein [Bifidobacteriaceae bacterium]MCI1914558.1 hypothetical protein [Bifidobacteriaceae bacterium]